MSLQLAVKEHVRVLLAIVWIRRSVRKLFINVDRNVVEGFEILAQFLVIKTICRQNEVSVTADLIIEIDRERVVFPIAVSIFRAEREVLTWKCRNGLVRANQ